MSDRPAFGNKAQTVCAEELCDHLCGTHRKTLQHLAYAVTRGRKVTISVPGRESFCGYLGGVYTDMYLLLVPYGRTGASFGRKLIARSQVSDIDLAAEATYEQEPSRPGMEEIIAPFRAAMYRQILGRQEPTNDRKV